MDIRRLGDLDFAGKHVTVVGLGIEGVDLVRYLSHHGASVTISDSKPRDTLAHHISEVNDLNVNLSIGANRPEDIAGAEAVFVSQGVPLDLPGIAEARRRGVPLGSMLALYTELCPGPIAGITGSSGKSTTTALVGEILEADERPVFVGGNIGIGLLDHLAAVRAYTWSILEISHTQLQLVERSPHVAAILNITPNHLDRFSWDEYRRLKANLIRCQTPADTAVLNYDDPECRTLKNLVKGRLLWFSLTGRIPADGVFVRDGWAVLRMGAFQERLFPLDSLLLPGRHNQANALAAAAIATACGVAPEAIACAVESFRGVPHRLELVGGAGGVRYYNDSIATTPERTIAGLRSFSAPAVLLLGGRDKHLPLDELAVEAAGRCRAVVLFGESAAKLEIALKGAPAARRLPIVRVETLPDAVAEARRQAQAGDVVLLSPACTSFDAYDNFERRGEHFTALVRGIAGVVSAAAREEALPSLP